MRFASQAFLKRIPFEKELLKAWAEKFSTETISRLGELVLIVQ